MGPQYKVWTRKLAASGWEIMIARPGNWLWGCGRQRRRLGEEGEGVATSGWRSFLGDQGEDAVVDVVAGEEDDVARLVGGPERTT